MDNQSNATRHAASVSVIICAYTLERWDDICLAVESVEAQSLAPEEIILVVDHNDKLLARAQQAFDQILVVANTGPQGLSGARNTGWGVASGEIVAFLDDDASAEGEWLQRLVEPYEAANVAGVGGFIAPDWRVPQPPSFPEEFLWVVGCSYRGLPESREHVRNVIGANMSLRREALVVAGGFDSALGRIGTRPVGCEETELCLRISRVVPGSVFVYEPAAKVSHAVPQARSTWSYFRARCYSEGLSKAHVRRLSGAESALSTERSYVRQTLPAGVARALVESVRTRRGATMLRAAGIIVGLAWTTAGFVVGSFRSAAPSAVESSAGQTDHAVT